MGLAALAAGESGAGVAVGRARSVGKTVFVFPGRGPRGAWERSYMPNYPVRPADAVAEELDRHLRPPLRNVPEGCDEALLTSTEFAQPVIAIEVALATLLQHWGIGPDSRSDIRWARSRQHISGRGVVVDRCGGFARPRQVDGGASAGGDGAVAASEEEVLPVLVDMAHPRRSTRRTGGGFRVRGSGQRQVSITDPQGQPPGASARYHMFHLCC